MDKQHLAEQDLKAQGDLRDADARFRTWLRKYAAVVGAGNEDLGWHPDDIPGLVNLSSSAQIQTLLFGGFTSAKDVLKKPTTGSRGGGGDGRAHDEADDRDGAPRRSRERVPGTLYMWTL